MKEKIRMVVIGGSAGSFQVVTKILSELHPGFRLPVFLCLHRLKNVSTGFEEALNIRASHRVCEPNDKEVIKKSKIYLAPSNYHMLAEIGNSISLSTADLYHFSRPSIDLCFDSFSYLYREKCLVVILSGANKDGAEGIHRAHQRGAYTIVQDPEEAIVKTMVNGALELFTPHQVLKTDEIIAFINKLG